MREFSCLAKQSMKGNPLTNFCPPFANEKLNRIRDLATKPMAFINSLVLSLHMSKIVVLSDPTMVKRKESFIQYALKTNTIELCNTATATLPSKLT